MAVALLLYQETNLVGEIVTQNVLPNSTTIYARFTDLKTGVARTPQASTKYFTLNKDNSNFEAILASSHSTTDGITTITVATNGRNMPLYGTGLGSSTGNSHSIGDPIGCVYTHQQLGEALAVLDGTNGSNGPSFRIGRELDENITLYAQNTDTNKPFVRYDAATNKWLISNDGVNTYDPEAGGSGVTAGNGISITAGAVAVRLKAGGGLQFDGGEIELTVANTVVDHVIYTPAFLTSGNAPETNVAAWAGVTNGSFRVTIDGTARNIDGINFTGVASLANVASTIQTAIRTVTSGLETVTWNGSAFIIASGNTTSSSSITVLSTSTGTVGTDISGAGAFPYLDSETARGTVTNAVLDPTADAGKTVATDTNGNINTNLLNAVDTSAGVADAGKVVKLNSNGVIDNSMISSPPIVRVYTDTTQTIGAASSQFDITNPSGTTFRYTWDGTGTDPNINPTTIPIGTVLTINTTNFSTNNNGVFTVTGVGTNYFEVTNASGFAQNNVTIGANAYIAFKQKVIATWTKPANLDYATIELVGGGGGGGGDIGAGGGGGGYAKKTVAASSLGATEVVTLGFGGGRGFSTVNPQKNATQGGTTSFGSILSATGGTGGGGGDTAPVPGGLGGQGLSGDINCTGQQGGTGAESAVISGNGGASFFGGNFYGGGGTGGNPGDFGGNGVVIVTEYY